MSADDKKPVSRRTVFTAAGGAGVLAAAAAALPLVQRAEEAPKRADLAGADPAGGYQLTPHVLRYYQTARV